MVSFFVNFLTALTTWILTFLHRLLSNLNRWIGDVVLVTLSIFCLSKIFLARLTGGFLRPCFADNIFLKNAFYIF